MNRKYQHISGDSLEIIVPLVSLLYRVTHKELDLYYDINLRLWDQIERDHVYRKF